VLVLTNVHTASVHALVNPAVVGVTEAAGVTLLVRVPESLAPSLSVTVSVTVNSVAADIV
jgi:hypothetical protein